MRKFTRYRIAQDRGLFYIETPVFWLFWIRIRELNTVETMYDYRVYVNDYEFTSKEDAVAFAEANMYKILT